LPCFLTKSQILPTKTCQRHLETRAANVWDLVQTDRSEVDFRGGE